MNIRVGLLIFIMSSLACSQTTSTVSKDRPFQPVSVTIEGLNQLRSLLPITITDREQLETLVGFFDSLDEDPPKKGFHVDYSEEYKVVFSMPNGSKVIVLTLYNDGYWNRGGRFFQHLRPGLSEFLEPFFRAQR